MSPVPGRRSSATRFAVKSKTKAPTGDVRDISLARFARQLDEHAGAAVGFDDLIEELAQTRITIGHLKRTRAELFEQIKGAHALGHTVVIGTGYELRLSVPSEPAMYRTVPSEVVKRVSVAAWRRAQAEVRFVSVKAPGAITERMAAAAERMPVPDLRQVRTLATVVLAYKEHPAWETLRELRDRETETVERLDALAADFGWDGMPIIFADGWTAGLRRRQYSSERLAEIEPELFARLAVTKVAQKPAHVYVGRPGDEGDDGAVDLDGD